MESLFILLPDRCQYVLELLGQGLTKRDISRRTRLKYSTVTRYVYDIKDYFDVPTVRVAVERARRWGFLGPAGSPVGSGLLYRIGAG